MSIRKIDSNFITESVEIEVASYGVSFIVTFTSRLSAFSKDLATLRRQPPSLLRGPLSNKVASNAHLRDQHPIPTVPQEVPQCIYGVPVGISNILSHTPSRQITLVNTFAFVAKFSENLELVRSRI